LAEIPNEPYQDRFRKLCADGGQATGARGSSIRESIDAVARSGRYSTLPPPTGSRGGGSGSPKLKITNSTSYGLTVDFAGAVERSLKLASGQSVEIELAPGSYRVLGRVDAPNVLPFLGDHNYEAGGSYTSSFYLESK
jgi:hypothetical protein